MNITVHARFLEGTDIPSVTELIAALRGERATSCGLSIDDLKIDRGVSLKLLSELNLPTKDCDHGFFCGLDDDLKELIEDGEETQYKFIFPLHGLKMYVVSEFPGFRSKLADIVLKSGKCLPEDIFCEYSDDVETCEYMSAFPYFCEAVSKFSKDEVSVVEEYIAANINLASDIVAMDDIIISSCKVCEDNIVLRFHGFHCDHAIETRELMFRYSEKLGLWLAAPSWDRYKNVTLLMPVILGFLP